MILTLPELRHRRVDVAIVGAGPAGLAAAELLREHEHELETIVIDEQRRAGGQILRQPPATFRTSNWLASALYRRPKVVLASVAEDDGIGWLFGATVLGLQQQGAADPGHGLWVQSGDGCALIRAGIVLLAPGAYERPLPFPGWTLPGVMGAGAIQAFVKSQQFVPGNRFLLAGSHPLQLVVADQLVAAGADVAAVLFTQKLRNTAGMARDPVALFRSARQLGATAGVLRRLRRAAVPVCFGASLLRVEGGDEVERAIVAPIGPDGELEADRAESIDCDRVGMCYGFSVSSELARQAGAAVRYCPDSGGWPVEHDAWYESSVPRLFAAGEITGMAGAEAALDRGRIAALGILRLLGVLGEGEAARRARPVRRRSKKDEQFAAMLRRMSRPPAGLARALRTEDTVICRCESVTFGELRKALDEHAHIRSANAAKLCTRAGMGMCQGRLCGENVAQLVACARDLPPAEVGTFTAQFPVKPLSLDSLPD